MSDPLATLASMQVTTGTPEPPPTYGQLTLQLAQLQTRQALLEQRSARQEAQLAELMRRLDAKEGDHR